MALTVESKISALLGNERSKAIIDKHFPGLSADPRLGMALGMTLGQILPLSGGRITPQALKAISEDLAQL